MAIRYLWYRISAPHRKGFGINSPFVFSFITNVLLRKDDCGLAEIRIWRKTLSSLDTELEVSDAGAGSKVHGRKKRSVRSIIAFSSVSHKYGRILYSLARVFRPAGIIELGTGIGISTAYLSAGNPDAGIISIEADSIKASFAQKLLAAHGNGNVEICNGIFREVLLSKIMNIHHPLLVFIDGDHNHESVISYFETVLKYKNEDTIIVLDDIRWSDGMFRAWREIAKNPEVSVSIDLFFIGIVFFRKGITKQEFMINF